MLSATGTGQLTGNTVHTISDNRSVQDGSGKPPASKLSV
jgi:hypothetical protein